MKKPLKVLAFVLAGGKGTRLYPLTKERAKPAVPFGGRYRIVDFVLSNLINSGIHSIYVLIQFKSQSLLQHLSDGWEARGLMNSHFIIPVPAQMRLPGESWYRGTADAIFQNINLIEQSEPDVIAIFGADHIYRMDIRQMIDFHVERGSQATVAALPVDKSLAGEFGSIECDSRGRITGFHEKDPNAPTIPGNPNQIYASMGNYIFSRQLLLDELYADGAKMKSSHDFGKDILPGLIGRVPMYAYDFETNRIDGDPVDQPVYWRDVGTLDAFYEASMDLRSVKPELNLYNRRWPLRTAGYTDPPAKFTFDNLGRRGSAVDSIVSGGSILSGCEVRNSIIGRGVKIYGGAVVEDSVIFDGCEIAGDCKIRKVILDKNVKLEPGTTIGFDKEADSRNPAYHTTPTGIVVVEGARSRVDIGTLE
jgi:glucose-1-phosphate adenylyltransferase